MIRLWLQPDRNRCPTTPQFQRPGAPSLIPVAPSRKQFFLQRVE
jgi:hypothetical protein